MKKSLLFVSALAAICIMPSCKKEQNGSNGNGGNNEPTPKTIVFGDYEGMNVVKFDKSDLKYDTIASEHHGVDAWYYEADLNQDGVADINLTSTAFNYPCSDYRIRFYLPAQHSELVVTYHSCTVHYDHPFYYHCDTIIRAENDTTIVEYRTIETCQKMSESDSLIYSSHPFQNWEENNQGDIFIAEYDPSYFPTDILELFNSHVIEYFPDSDEIISNDTIFRHLFYSDFDCFNIQLGVEKFVGFMAREHPNKPKYGWFKFIIEPDENGHIIAHLLETAIEE